jgi:hypothetical protein
MNVKGFLGSPRSEEAGDTSVKLLSSRLSSHAFSPAEGRGLGCATGRAGRLFSIHVRYRLSICNMSFQKRCASCGNEDISVPAGRHRRPHCGRRRHHKWGDFGCSRRCHLRADFESIKKVTDLSSSSTPVRACAWTRRLRDASRSLSTAVGSTQAVAIAARMIGTSGV